MNNIDKIFNEKLKDFEKNPPKMAWEKIEAGLEEKNKKGGIFWYSIAAGLALIFTLSLFVFTKNEEKAGLSATDEWKPLEKKPLVIQKSNAPVVSEEIKISKVDLNISQTSPAIPPKKRELDKQKLLKEKEEVLKDDLEITPSEIADLNNEKIEFLPEEKLALEEPNAIVEQNDLSIQVIIKKGSPTLAHSIDTASPKQKNKLERAYEQVVNLKNFRKVDLEEVASLLSTNKKEKSTQNK